MSTNNQLLAEIGVQLTTLAVKGTASAVSNKIETIKLEKDLEKAKNKYEEIISQLLSEREEAVRIAQTYKSEVERYEISDDDIIHLQNTLARALELLSQFGVDKPIKEIDKIKSLISVDTLKAMQLLGFNYKDAIGEPLTSLCASKIMSLDSNNKRGLTKQKK